jgi:hypothetical protein
MSAFCVDESPSVSALAGLNEISPIFLAYRLGINVRGFSAQDTALRLRGRTSNRHLRQPHYSLTDT